MGPIAQRDRVRILDSLAYDYESRQVHELLAKGRFHPVYQPIYALDDGLLVSVEALTRFESPIARPPDIWFEYAAKTHLAVMLDVAVIDAALEGARDLPDAVALHINVKPATLLDSRLLRLLDAHASRPIVIEITEHEPIDDYQRFEPIRRELRDRDIKIAVDDAGAGFASLRHIVTLNPEIIKLDISLTQNVRQDPVRYAMAEALIQFATEMGSQLIAEGIEHPNDLATWQELGADAAQGYLLRRPGALPVARICRRILDH